MDFKSEASFKWLYSQKITKIKDIARVVQACYLWKEENNYTEELTEKLIKLKNRDSWNSDLRDTSRATSALALKDIVFPEVERWLLSKQTEGSWNNDVYDSAYALISLADMGSYNHEGCMWLVENYGKKWEHPGTTALIITSLLKQEKIKNEKIFNDFAEERAKWIITQLEKDGAWKTLATSNLVIQSLLLAGHKDNIVIPIQWILSCMNSNGSWGKEGGDINTTSLSLITLQEWSK
ncbi:hypothetical protein [Methanolobus psychrotolerans]|uniref:hypothetical protein n=1 Tax=Methanolobus psychrotolerans TaxID=1874706 RepID=UPI0013EBC741|nr:hypothetical protein [Methanolobus psychrotolerans]